MKLDILAAFNTNSRRLIRIWRSWGLIPSRNRKQGVDMLIIYYHFFREIKVSVHIPKIAISAEFCIILAPERCRGNEIGYPRGF